MIYILKEHSVFITLLPCSVVSNLIVLYVILASYEAVNKDERINKLYIKSLYHACMRIHTYIHTYIPTYIHTHIHTCIQTHTPYQNSFQDLAKNLNKIYARCMYKNLVRFIPKNGTRVLQDILLQ